MVRRCYQAFLSTRQDVQWAPVDIYLGQGLKWYLATFALYNMPCRSARSRSRSRRRESKLIHLIQLGAPKVMNSISDVQTQKLRCPFSFNETLFAQKVSGSPILKHPHMFVCWLWGVHSNCGKLRKFMASWPHSANGPPSSCSTSIRSLRPRCCSCSGQGCLWPSGSS